MPFGLSQDLSPISRALCSSKVSMCSIASWERGVYDKELQTFVNRDTASAITLSRVLVYHSVMSTSSSRFKYWSRMIKTLSSYLCTRSVPFVCFCRHIAIMEVFCIDSTMTEVIPAKCRASTVDYTISKAPDHFSLVTTTTCSWALATRYVCVQHRENVLHCSSREEQASVETHHDIASAYFKHVYKTPPKCHALNQPAHLPSPNHLCWASDLDANTFSVVAYAVHHPGQNMIVHNPAEVEASLRYSNLQPDSCATGTAKTSVELCQVY